MSWIRKGMFIQIEGEERVYKVLSEPSDESNLITVSYKDCANKKSTLEYETSFDKRDEDKFSPFWIQSQDRLSCKDRTKDIYHVFIVTDIATSNDTKKPIVHVTWLLSGETYKNKKLWLDNESLLNCTLVNE